MLYAPTQEEASANTFAGAYAARLAAARRQADLSRSADQNFDQESQQEQEPINTPMVPNGHTYVPQGTAPVSSSPNGYTEFDNALDSPVDAMKNELLNRARNRMPLGTGD